jgi:hypothetical protein
VVLFIAVLQIISKVSSFKTITNISPNFYELGIEGGLSLVVLFQDLSGDFAVKMLARIASPELSLVMKDLITRWFSQMICKLMLASDRSPQCFTMRATLYSHLNVIMNGIWVFTEQVI